LLGGILCALPGPDSIDELQAGDGLIRQPSLVDRVPAVLAAYGLRCVVVHLDKPPRNDARRLKKLLGRVLPESAIIWDDEKIRAYRVPDEPDRRGVVVGMGLEWGPIEGDHRCAAEAANVVLLLLDRSAREVLLRGSAFSYREPGEIDVAFNGRPRTTLRLTSSPQPLAFPLILQPGHNVIRLETRGLFSERADGRQRGLALGALRVDGED